MNEEFRDRETIQMEKPDLPEPEPMEPEKPMRKNDSAEPMRTMERGIRPDRDSGRRNRIRRRTVMTASLLAAPLAFAVMTAAVLLLEFQVFATRERMEEYIRNGGDWGWFSDVPGMDGITFRADNHVFGLDLSRAADLTEAEFEGRRRAFALEKLLKSHVSPDYAIVNLCSAIGIRETAHYRSRYQITADELLLGKRFDDAILQGTYRVDIHHNGDNGITFKELDGGMRTEHGKGGRAEIGNWRAEMGLSGDYARFYQMPFEVLKLERWQNVIPAGRMINADDGAFGALRVMVNLNQTGEAAGVAAVKCLESGVSVQALDGRAVRQALAAGGSAL